MFTGGKQNAAVNSHFDDCEDLLETATYQTHTLMELLYTFNCKPLGWEGFFDRADVMQMMEVISGQIQYDSQVENYGINPDIGNVFRAFNMVSPEELRAVILGQDPAPQPGLATGLAFSLDPSVDPSEVPSVQRVILEARNGGYCVNASDGVLVKWAEEGVLLLNTALTLIQNEIGSHLELWENFTQAAIDYTNENTNPSVWILWGSHAKAFESSIDKSKHYILKGGHPSPNADGKYFFCHNYFACASEWLCEKGRGMIDWNLLPLPCQKHASRLYHRLHEDPGYCNGDLCEMWYCPY